MKEEKVILVDRNDRPIGEMEKMEAHKKGVLHRAFSIFIFNDQGEILLQKRAGSKYHSGGLWTNTCCSHPRPGESIMDAANRRLQEEMGIQCKLEEKFTFIYRAELDNNLIEHELDYVFTGTCSQKPKLNPEEAEDFRFEKPEKVLAEIKENPQAFTKWFIIAFNELSQTLKV
jgi:isopentenyl-diphosphate Delta-isomerase